MDPIDFYLRKNKKISLLLLAHAHAKLSMVMLQQGFITYEDALKTICFYANQSPIATEVVVHAGILYEASFLPSVTKKGQIAHKLSPDTIGNEIALLERVFNILGGRTGGIDCPSIEELRREASAALGHDFFSASHVPRNPEGHFHSYYSDNQQQFGQEVSSRVPAELLSRVPDNIDLADDYRSGMLTRIECEKSEPIVRLLAQVRKVGMDILFPQITHDKILACIFAAIRSAATPAHRELIDMVMLVKESQKINHLQTVSKTKVRGVLALLKHGEMLITHGNDGNPVRLYLAKGINSFRDLRERHDAFVLKYMMEHHLFMPAILKSELVWQVDEDTRSLRAEAMNKLTLSLQSFFDQIGSFSGDSIPHCDDSVLQAPRSQAHSVGPPRYTDNNGMSEHVYNRIQKDFLHSSPQQIHDFERAGVGLKNGVQPSYGYSNGQVIGNNNNPGSFYGGYRDSNGSSAIDNDGYIMRDHQRQSGLLSNMRDDKNILRSRTPLGPWHHQNPNEGISTFDQRWGDQVDNFDVSDGQTRSSRGNSSSSILTGDERIRDFVSEVSPMLPDTNYYANSVFGSLSAVSKSEGSAMGPLKLENMDFHGRSDGATITNIRQPSDLVEIPADFSPSTYNSRQRFVAYSIDPNSNT